MTATEPPAEPDPRPISEIIEDLLASSGELDRGDGPGGQAFYVLEVRGVPQATSGPYQAEPGLDPWDAHLAAEVDAVLWTGSELEAEGAAEADSAASADYQARVEADPEPEAEP
jgi:hypothetical protein